MMSEAIIREEKAEKRKRKSSTLDNVMGHFCAVAEMRNLCNNPAASIWGPRPYDPAMIDAIIIAENGKEVQLFATERWPGAPKWCASARAGFTEAFYGHWGRPVIKCAVNDEKLMLLSAFHNGMIWLKGQNLDTGRIETVPVTSLTGYRPKHIAIATGLRNRDGSYQLIELPKLSK